MLGQRQWPSASSEHDCHIDIRGLSLYFAATFPVGLTTSGVGPESPTKSGRSRPE